MAGFREDFTWLLASRVGTLGIGVVAGGLVSRALAPAGRGVLAEMQTRVGLSAVVFGLSLDSALCHFANRARYGDDDRQRFVTAVRVLLLAALVVAAAFAAFVLLRPGQVRFVALLGAVQSAAYLALVAGAAGRGSPDLGFAVFALIAAQAAVLAVLPVRAAGGGLWRGGFSARARGSTPRPSPPSATSRSTSSWSSTPAGRRRRGSSRWRSTSPSPSRSCRPPSRTPSTPG